jgi:hypothetical protein
MVSNIKANIFDDISKLMENEIVDNDKLEKCIVSLLEELSEIDKLDLPTSTIRDFFEKSSAWILKNFSSVKLNSIINLLSITLNKLGYRVDIRREGIFIYLYRHYRITTARDIRSAIKKRQER